MTETDAVAKITPVSRPAARRLYALSGHLEVKWKAATAVFVLSFLVSLAFYVAVPSGLENDPGTDYATYYEPVARNLLAGRGYVHPSDPTTLSTRYPPGFALQVAGSLWAARVFHIPENVSLLAAALAGMAFCSSLVFLFARSVWNTRPALLCSSVWMTYPMALWLVNGQNGEVPFQVALYSGLYVLWQAMINKSESRRAYFLAGALFGVAMLVRPIAIGMGLVAAPLIWFGARERSARLRLTVIASLLLGNLAAVVPWEGVVYAKTGQVVLLGTGGVVSLRDGLAFAINTKGYRQGVAVPEDVEELMQDVMAHYSELRSLKNIAWVVGQELRDRPGAVAKLLAIKAARSWYATDTNRREGQVLMLQVFYLLLAVWGSAAGWRSGGILRKLVVTVWVVTGYFWGMNILSTTLCRYIVPAMGLLFVLIPACFIRLRASASGDALPAGAAGD
jgi:hypothetical protein